MSFAAAQKQTDIVIARLIASREKEIIREYAKALKTIRSDLALAYEKYAIGKELTYAEMAKYGRLANLERQIFGEINALTGKNAVKLNSTLGHVYQETYYRTAFNIESEAQARLGFGQLNPNTIRRALDNPFDKYGAGAKKDTLGYLIRNSRNQEQLKAQIRSELTQGLIKGQSYQEMARTLKRRLEIGTSNALRIVQAEGHRVQTQGRLDSLGHAQKKGVEMAYKWVATLDMDTRRTHQAMDGKMTDEDGAFEMPGVGKVKGPGLTGVASEDINCRCTVIGVIEGYEPEVRRAREDGIIDYKEYEDYAKDKGWPQHYKGSEPRVMGTYTGKDPNAFTGEIFTDDAEKLKGFIKEKFGEDATATDIAKATGAHGNEEVLLNVSKDDRILFDIQGTNYSARGYIEPWHGDKYLYIDRMMSKGGGHAARLVGMQSEHLSKIGINTIKLEAAGIKGGWNGYYTWPRLGFNGNLTAKEIARLPKPLKGATTLHELMMRPEGAAWWKEYGSTVMGTFDVTPGSISRQILEIYLRGKGF